jgi:thioredoxin-related protein
VVATLVARNANEAMMAGVRNLESTDRICIDVFGRNTFSYLTEFKKKFYTFRTFNAICRENTAINCINSQHKLRSSPSNSTGYTTILRFIINLPSVLVD